MSYLENFNYSITGSTEQRQKLVFLHGVMGFGLNWRTVTKALDSAFQCLVYDQRGHGRSFHPENGYAPEDYAQDLKLILDELGWNQVNLVGHSMGGRNALEFAHRFPSRVAKLVIEDIGPVMRETAAESLLTLLNSVPVPFENKRLAKEFFDTKFLEIFKARDDREGIAQFFYANIIEDKQGRAVWRFSEKGVRESIVAGRTQDRWSEIETLQMPTLLVRGEHSRDLPRDLFDEVLKRNPSIQGIEIKGAGHWVHSDQPEAFIAALRTFLLMPL